MQETTSLTKAPKEINSFELREKKDTCIQAGIDEFNLDDWNWEEELPRNPPWRRQLIAETKGGIKAGFVQVIYLKEEETHYWSDDCPPNL